MFKFGSQFGIKIDMDFFFHLFRKSLIKMTFN